MKKQGDQPKETVLMWTYEHTIETAASPDQLWALYSDIQAWPRWNPGVEEATLDGAFAEGSGGVMTFRGFGPLPYRIVTVSPPHVFADETTLPSGITVRFTHTIEPAASGSRLTHAVTINGPGADAFGAQTGPAITNDIPQTMASLANHALASPR